MRLEDAVVLSESVDQTEISMEGEDSGTKTVLLFESLEL